MILAQIIGLIAFVLFISSVWQKNKEKLLVFQLLANFLYGIQYILLLAPTAGYMNMISVVRSYIYFLYEKKNKKPSILVLLLFIGLIITVGILTFDSYLTIIPISITIIYAVSTWQNNIKIVRYCFLICAVIWMFYNISVGAYTAVIGNIFEFASGLISIIKYNKKQV